MPLDPAYLTLLTTLKEELRISASTYDTLLQNYIARVSYDFASRCNRVFYYVKQVTDNVAGYASTLLRVPHTPIDTTQPISVTFDGALFDPSIYSVSNPEVGFIFNKTGWYWTAPLLPNVRQNPMPGQENPLYAVTYSGGWVTPQQASDNPTDPILSVRTLPYDIEQAVLTQCVMFFRRGNVDPTIQSQHLMNYSVSYRKDWKNEMYEATVQRYRRYGTSR